MIISCVLGYFETVRLNMHDNTFFLLSKRILRVCPTRLILTVSGILFYNERNISCGAVGFTENMPMEEKSTLNCLYWKKKNTVSCSCSGIGLLILHVFNTL